MRTKSILTAAAGIMLYAAGVFYIGWHFWQSVESIVVYGLITYYWLIFAALAGTYFLGRIAAVFLPGDISDKLIWFGAYCLGITFYMILLWLAFDALVIARHLTGFWRAGSSAGLYSGLTIAFAAIAIVCYGDWRASSPTVRHYDITINKRARNRHEMRVVVISDIHAGLLVGRKRLERAVQMINGLEPELVLLPGDIIDENIGAFVENEMPEILRGIRAPLGVFGVPGSHEYIWGHADKALDCLNKAGINILRDNYVIIDDSIYLVGRDDLLREQIVGTPRQKLSVILQNCDHQSAIILLDHQPVELDEARLAGVDLQLSGHTHHGQMFPLNLITKAFFTLDWGYFRRGQYQLIVSSGYGTWGPPIRIGTSSEIVEITINFMPPD